jgi:hypothetical protein
VADSAAAKQLDVADLIAVSRALRSQATSNCSACGCGVDGMTYSNGFRPIAPPRRAVSNG